MRRPRMLAVVVSLGLATTACAAGHRPPAALPTVVVTTVPVTVATTTSTVTAATTTSTTLTSTSNPLTTGVAAFVSSVAPLAASDIPFSWHPGCPLAPTKLRMLHMSYWGFDNQAHTGVMVVNAAVTSDVLKIFSRLFAEHFPIHQMQPVDAYQGSDPMSMAADNTSGFNCRYAVPPGNPPSWSVHAFGEAIDVNTVENPYIEGGTVTPAAGAAFLDRSTYRPGMAVPAGQLVQAFASAGWQWGGRWSASPDYQHFSKTGG